MAKLIPKYQKGTSIKNTSYKGKFTKGSQWEVVKDLKGYPSHEQGGVDIKLGKNGFSFTRNNSVIEAKHGLVLSNGSIIPDDKKNNFKYKPYTVVQDRPYTAVQDNTYVAPKIVMPLKPKKKQQFVPREQPVLKADTRTDQERKIAQKYTESVLNPSIRTQIGEALQKPLRWIADPVKGVGDIVSVLAPNSALAKDLPNTNAETFEHRKKQLNPYTSNKEKINSTINEAIPLTNWALLNTLPVEAAAGHVVKSGKNLIKPEVGKSTTSLIKKGVESTKESLNNSVQNVYKINPWAFKPNPEAYYRVGDGKEFIDDVLRTNKIRVYNKNSYANLREAGKISGIREDGKIVLKAKTFPEADTYWSKGVPLDGRFSSQKYGDYMIEASNDIPFIQAVNQKTKQRGFWDAPDVNYNSTHAKSSYVKPRQSYGYDAEGNIIPSIGTPLEYNPEFIKLYRPHWLKGYKEIKVPKKQFKSEINWGKWNKEIPNNKALMKEYEAIEKSSKANGTWMKNPDGTDFPGTPEQFVQQNSSNFKKAFPDEFEITFRGAMYNYPDQGRFNYLFSGDKKVATNKHYTVKNPTLWKPTDEIGKEASKKNGGLYELFSNKPDLNIDAKKSNFHAIDFPDIAKNYKNSSGSDRFVSTDNIADHMIKNDINGININNVLDESLGNIKITNTKLSPVKSRWYNNGMFDMTNPNIYKGLIPPALMINYLKSKTNEDEKSNL